MNMKIRTKTAVAVACAVFSAGYPGAVPAYAEDAGFDIGTYLGITGGVSGNAVYSPASLSMALGLAASGANGDTAASMKKLLLGREKAEAADLPEFYSAFSGRIAAIGRRGDVDLVCANSLWTDVSFEIKPPFKTLAADSFGAGVSSVDLAMSGAAEINAWVTAKTKGMIKKIVDDLNNARMVIVNAVYFKGEWRFPFEASRTRPRPFRSGNEVKNVPAMSQTENFAYAKKDGFTALKMPYKDAAVSMLILLPDADDGLESLEKSLTEEKLADIRDSMSFERVSVQIPKFRFESYFAREIRDCLEKHGIASAFTPDADFSGISGAPGELYIGGIVQKAVLEVSEKGTEAAAATAMVMLTNMGPGSFDPPKLFTADHPFFFMITADTGDSSDVLFAGRVVNP